MIWFKKNGWVHIPVSIIGIIVALVTLALNVWFFLVIDSHSHSGSDTLINFFPYCVCFWAVYGWIARNTSS